MEFSSVIVEETSATQWVSPKVRDEIAKIDGVKVAETYEYVCSSPSLLAKYFVNPHNNVMI